MPSSRKAPRPSADRILVCAEHLFTERGYAAPSLRDLIAACGCSTTAFYARFPTKDAVLQRLIEGLLDELLSAAASALPRASSVPHGFELGLEVLVATIAGRKGLVRVALTAEEPHVRQLLHDRYRALAALLSTELSEAHHADSPARAWALVGALEMAVRRWAVFGEIEDDELSRVLHATAAALLPR